MKYMFKFILLTMCIASLTSCLKKDLPGIKSSNQNNLTGFYLEYKWQDTTYIAPGTPNTDTSNVVSSVQFTDANSPQIISNDTLYAYPLFPSNLPLAQKLKVTLNHAIGFADIPDGAVVKPLNGAPELGIPGDYTKPASYEITAADGTKSTWVIVINPLPAVSQYEGQYIESGYFDHATAGHQACPSAYLSLYCSSINANTIQITAGYWYFSNTGITFYATVNADNSVTIAPDPSAAVSVQPGVAPESGLSGTANYPSNAKSTYNPVTKTYDLYYYYYSGGSSANWRTFHQILVHQ